MGDLEADPDDIEDVDEIDDDEGETKIDPIKQESERLTDQEYFAKEESPFVGTIKTKPDDEESSDFTARVLAKLMSQEPETMQSAPLGGVDQFGQELKEFKCRRCGRIDAIDPWQYEIQNRHGVLCMPCHVPHLYKAVRDPEMPNGWLLVPQPAGIKPRSRLGEDERRELQGRVNELLDLKIRRDYLLESMLKMQSELSEIEPRIATLTGQTIPAATSALEKIESDPMLEKKQESADIVHDINALFRSLAKVGRDAKMKKKTGRR